MYLICVARLRPFDSRQSYSGMAETVCSMPSCALMEDFTAEWNIVNADWWLWVIGWLKEVGNVL